MYIKKVAYSYTYTHKRPQEAGVFTCLEGCADGWTDGVMEVREHRKNSKGGEHLIRGQEKTEMEVKEGG